MNFRFFSIILVFFSFSPEINSQNNLINLSSLTSEFSYEIRYATPNNFMGEILYNCAICMLQPKVATALLAANNYLCEKGYRIKLYDCYRPLDVQKKMWVKVPRPAYVANPYRKGSIHNKGAAVDITIETLEGCFVDMGSDYDFFGREAHIDNYNFSEKILKNRKILIGAMRLFGFNTVRTEWWHFSYKKNWSYPTLNTALPCKDE
ncbi:MAG: D-alanyl-D-alanine dipeptidase [Parvicella sp.]|jgi:D-alanyl-D-alanine dipeptidase